MKALQQLVGPKATLVRNQLFRQHEHRMTGFANRQSDPLLRAKSPVKRLPQHGQIIKDLPSINRPGNALIHLLYRARPRGNAKHLSKHSHSGQHLKIRQATLPELTKHPQVHHRDQGQHLLLHHVLRSL